MTACPICGKGDTFSHRCKPRTLAKIENERKRELLPPKPPTYNERLEVGFLMLKHSEEQNALPQWS